MDWDLIDDFVSYDEATGNLIWKDRSYETYIKHDVEQHIPAGGLKAWNAANSGRPAFLSSHPSGKRGGMFLGIRLRADAVVWMMHAGEWPSTNLYHINGDNSDNRIENLCRVKPNKSLERRMAAGVRPTDTVGEYGGDIYAFRNNEPEIKLRSGGDGLYMDAICKEFDLDRHQF